MGFNKNDPPKLWEFKGPCAPETYYELRVFGRPDARAIRNCIRQLELYATFVEEKAPADRSLDDGSPTNLATLHEPLPTTDADR